MDIVGKNKVLEPMQVDFEYEIEAEMIDETVEGQEGAREPQDQPANEEQIHFQVIGPSNIDLDNFRNIYEGNILLERLRFICDHSEMQRVDALVLLLRSVKKTMNCDLYIEIHEKLVRQAGLETAGPIDEHWILETKKRIASTTDTLENSIKTVQKNAIKESIKRGYEEMAEHRLQLGDIQGALKYFSKSRDYCIQPTHIRQMCLNVIKSSVLLNNWVHVQSYVTKAEQEKGTGNIQQPPSVLETSRINCAGALADMAGRRYADAAKKFLSVTFDGFQYGVLLSAGDVAKYGGLLSLATLSRKDLKDSLLQSTNFKQFLELEPIMRETILAFVESRYCDALKHLKILKNGLLLDFFLSSHVAYLYSEIRMRSLQQYLQPFINAKIDVMARSFNTSEENLKVEIACLIADGRIPAKIDHLRGVIVQKERDLRTIAVEKALNAQSQFIWKSQSLLLRQGVIRAGISVGENPQKVQAKMEVTESNTRIPNLYA